MKQKNFFANFPDEGEVDLFETLAELVILTACRCLLGPVFRKKVSKEFAPLYQDLSDGMNHVSFFFPNLPTKKHKARNVAREKIAKLFTAAVQERRKTNDKYEDFLQVLIDSKYSDGSSPTDAEIVGLLLAALFAGQHTSSITSTWTGMHIIHNKKKISPSFTRRARACT